MVHLSLVPQQNSAILALQLPSQDSVQVQKAWLRMHLAATQLQEAHWSLEAPKVWDRLSKSSFIFFPINSHPKSSRVIC